MAEMSLKCSQCSKMLPTSMFYVRKNTKRGFHSKCKECSLNKPHNETMDKSTKHKAHIVVQNQHKTYNPMLVMSALNNCPSYEHFVQILEHIGYSLDFDIVFQFVAKQYPEKYVEVFVLMQNILDTQGTNQIDQTEIEQNEIEKEQSEQEQIEQSEQEQIEPEQNEQDEFEQEEIEQNESKPDINTLSTSQQYILQYKNDPTMTQLGDDFESDEEHDIMTVRSGDKYVKVKVKKHT